MRSIVLPLLLSTFAFGQGVRIGDGQPLMTTAAVSGVTVLVPVANANIQICNHPANAVPCTNRITTYTDVTLGTACTGANQVVLANSNSCVAAADVRGNWGAWAPNGTYDWTFTNSSGNSFGPYTVSATSPTYQGSAGGLGQIVDTSTPNAGATGTTARMLAKQVGSTIVNCANADAGSNIRLYPIAADISGSCAAGTSGNACKVIAGKANVTMDAGGVTINHFVGCSGTQAPKATDLGASVPPGQGCAGMALASVAGGQSVIIDTDACAVPAATGYATVKVAGSAVTQRTVLNLVNGLTCSDNAGTSSTDCSQGVVGLPDGSDTAGQQSLFFASSPTGSYFRRNTTANGFMFGYASTPQWFVANGGFEFSPLTSLYFTTDNTFASQQAAFGVCGSSGNQLCFTQGINPVGSTGPGIIRNAIYRLGGDTFSTNNGCGETTNIAGGATGGKITTSGTTSCTTIVTFGNLGAFTAPNGWACTVHDITTAASYNNPHHTSSGTTVTIVSGTIVASDVLEFACWPY